jgi:hypothetical protein
MKTLNAKKIGAVAAGAALFGLGLAFASPAAFANTVTFQNVTVISNSGQPVVQIVVGSQAKISDGIAAANIAAAIGNLAYTSVPVVASVNATMAKSILKPQVSSASYTLANQEVWLNESGTTVAAGSFGFTALIGSVINRGITLSTWLQTKSLQGSGQYTYPHSQVITPSGNPYSPYSAAGSVPLGSPPVATGTSGTGGGVTFSTYTSSGNDNILRVDPNELTGLLNNYGNGGESEYIWVTGIPVFNQSKGNFDVAGAGGAYQVVFGSPIEKYTSSNALNKATISLLGQQWVIINSTAKSTGTVATPGDWVNAGKLELASSLSNLTTVYVGHNITGAGFTVELTDLGQPNASGVSTASINVYYNGALTNTTQIKPGITDQFNVTGHKVYVYVNNTFAGLYAYQKWAKMQMYANILNLTDGQQFNKTIDPGWNVNLLWTNTSDVTNGKANALAGIIVYNTTPTTLSPGGSLKFIESPAAWKYTFVGDTLGNNFDAVTFTSNPVATGQEYTNIGNAHGGLSPSITNVTEPAAELTVTSQIPNAFSYSGQTGSSVVYDLTPYALTGVNTANTAAAAANMVTNGVDAVNVILAYGNVNAGNWINANAPLQVTLYGWANVGDNPTGSSPVSRTVTFTSPTTNVLTTAGLYNITDITLSRALPGKFGVAAWTYNDTGGSANTVEMATLNSITPGVLYQQSGVAYQTLSQTAIGNVIYNQQNSQPPTTWVLSSTTPPVSDITQGQYFTYTVNEVAVPSQTTYDSLQFGIDNSTAGVQANPVFQLNYTATSGTAGTHDNVTYTPTGLSSYSGAFNVEQGFRTERGSKVASISPSSLTFDIAKVVDTLQFAVGAVNTTTTSGSKTYGPFGIGQQVVMPGVSNVSVYKVAANITVKSGNYTISGLGNLSAAITTTPSVATTPTLLTNLSTTAPLVVLDSQASPSSNLILIGSGFVNTLSGQLQKSYNIPMTSTSQYVQAYGNKILVAGYYANQTTAAANQFIQALYAQAAQ